MVNEPGLSLTDWVVLALLVEQPAHGFAIARQLQAGADLGRVLTVHRSVVYRSVDRLVAAGLAEPHHTEPGDGGPNRTVHRSTLRGRSQLTEWLAQPVAHVRHIRIELLVKLRLLERAGQRPAHLVETQREALAGTLQGLTAPTDGNEGGDVVDLWRHHNAQAALAFLDALAQTDPAWSNGVTPDHDRSGGHHADTGRQ